MTIRSAFAWIALAALTGCGGEYKKVHGRLTVGGEPLAGANVVFVPVEGGPQAYAVTQEDGTFTMAASNTVTGVAAGTYSVLVTWQEPTHPYDNYREGSPKALELEKDYKEWKKTHKAKPSPVPPEYGEPARTPLKVQVPVAADVFNIDIPARAK